MKSREWKEKEVENLKSLLSSHPVVAIAGIRNIPAKQLQQVRSELSSFAKIRVTKNRIVSLALPEKMEKMKEWIDDQIAMIFTKEDPFKLYRILEQSKVKSPLRPNAIAPDDIEVPAGATPFKPGPILGDLQSLGIPAVVESGKVVVRKPAKVVRRGERVSQKLADILARLEIHPVDVGLDLKVAWEGGMIYTPDVLKIDESETISLFEKAERNALSLAINSAYPSRRSLPFLFAKARDSAKNLAIHAEIFEKGVIPDLLRIAYLHASSIKNLISDKSK
jgi:large subunit ribosomal protein L10